MNYRFKLSHSTRRLISLFIMFVLVSYTKAQEKPLTFEAGAFAITVLTEGQGQGNKGVLIGATDKMLEQCMPGGTFPNATNVFLVEAGKQTVLFDAGYGRKLFDNLKAYGKNVADINAIVLTHMHGDHIGGLLVDGQKAFPDAALYIPQPEYDYWMSDEAGDRGAQARNVIQAYKDKLHLFVPEEIGSTKEILPGVRAVAAYGHTPGHTGYMLESNGKKLFIWGDLTHAMAIQMPYPQVAVRYDVNPEQAVKSRLQILKYLSDNKIRIAGMHIEYPGIGDVKKNQAEGYDFTLTCECEGK